ncbi:MAG: hypothetical protein ABIB47_05505 [Candidatus Woesearchaeota archaeon]
MRFQKKLALEQEILKFMRDHKIGPRESIPLPEFDREGKAGDEVPVKGFGYVGFVVWVDDKQGAVTCRYDPLPPLGKRDRMHVRTTKLKYLTKGTLPPELVLGRYGGPRADD